MEPKIEIIYTDKAINEMVKEGVPTDLEMIFTDIAGEMYQADVYLKNGWTK